MRQENHVKMWSVPLFRFDRDNMNRCDSKTKTFNHSKKSNKWQKLWEEQENPLEKVCHPAGPKPAAEAPLSQVHVDAATGFDARKALGLQLRLFDTAIMAERAVYLDLCLIFLLFRFSLLKQGVVTRVILQSRRYFPAAPYAKHLTCACASFATASKVQY